MEQEPAEKNLELERLVFFSDAVVAIAITLLALDLKVVPAGKHLAFSDIAHAWHKFAAFFLSFVIIAVFWINHHRFFVYIRAIDPTLMIFNICWLMFLVLLPFTSTLISNDVFDKTAMLIYSTNVLVVTTFQTMIWQHVTHHKQLLKTTITESLEREYRLACYLALLNGVLAIGITIFSPLIAFITLITRSFLFQRSAQRYLEKVMEKEERQRKMRAGN